MGPVERIVELRDRVTGREVYDRFAERCLGSAGYGLLGAGGGLAATDHSLPISDIRRSSAFSLGRIRAAAGWLIGDSAGFDDWARGAGKQTLDGS